MVLRLCFQGLGDGIVGVWCGCGLICPLRLSGLIDGRIASRSRSAESSIASFSKDGPETW